MNHRRLLKSAASIVMGVLAGGAVDAMTTARATSHEGALSSGLVEVADGTRPLTCSGQVRPGGWVWCAE